MNCCSGRAFCGVSDPLVSGREHLESLPSAIDMTLRIESEDPGMDCFLGDGNQSDLGEVHGRIRASLSVKRRCGRRQTRKVDDDQPAGVNQLPQGPLAIQATGPSQQTNHLGECGPRRHQGKVESVGGCQTGVVVGFVRVMMR